MFITRIPLRISLFGGGSDLREFLEHFPGAVFSFAINKYIHIVTNHQYRETFLLHYSDIEETENVKNIKHPLFKEVFKKFNINAGIEVASFADIPSNGSGLGSSSAFTSALVKTVMFYKGESVGQYESAFHAADIEINKVGSNIGMQDHFGCSIGGAKIIRFSLDQKPEVQSFKIENLQQKMVEESFFLVDSGIRRSASDVLKKQHEKNNIDQYLDIQMKLVDLVLPGANAFMQGNLEVVSEILNESWRLKSKLTKKTTSAAILDICSEGLKQGALSCKLLGAGGGGFILFTSRKGDKENLKNFFNKKGLKTLDLKIDSEGLILLNNPFK